ncbi:2Fe-2S iron-sulfur cluster-binding protein [uncultured Roseovarius sp.]|uniref:2Fe-2S iron-sulfur cluster-binding protein n=1 Tax=uncultured Roseovarius sp. TaxID=293344 RepID=UPI00262794E5|nr:2Fe-2S iron-sulfur cluster-binding protein [uncultured Roseovarius sp.]
MLTISFIDTAKKKHEVETQVGVTLMEAAKAKAIPGIDADCGGSCACGTCAVSFSDEWKHLLDGRSKEEEDMLEFSVETPGNCRLACQITLTEAMNGLHAVVETEC